MQDKITITFENDHVHVVVKVDQSYERSLAMWKDIVQACEEHDCYNILGETHDTKPLETMDAFGHINIFKEAGVTLKHRIAWVAYGQTNKDAIHFTEMSLKNRGLVNGHVFDSVEDARAWLLGS